MIICGIDEAGRGPLAGPVVVASVIMKNGARIEGVRDSKKLTRKKREKLFDLILGQADSHHIAVVDNLYIDGHNILKAVMKGMEECIESAGQKNVKYMIDGNYFRLADGREKEIDFETVVKGDDKVYEISCASILAKVTRDRIMAGLHEIYPAYGFDTNMGYGTKKHIDAILKHGPCEAHRMTFLKNILIRIPLFGNENG